MTASCLQIVVASTTIFLAAGRFGLTPSANRLASPGLKLQGNDSGLKTGDPAGFTATDVLYLGTIGETSTAIPVISCAPAVEAALCTWGFPCAPALHTAKLACLPKTALCRYAVAGFLTGIAAMLLLLKMLADASS